MLRTQILVYIYMFLVILICSACHSPSFFKSGREEVKSLGACLRKPVFLNFRRIQKNSKISEIIQDHNLTFM